MEKRWWFISR